MEFSSVCLFLSCRNAREMHIQGMMKILLERLFATFMTL